MVRHNPCIKLLFEGERRYLNLLTKTSKLCLLAYYYMDEIFTSLCKYQIIYTERNNQLSGSKAMFKSN